MNNSAWGDHGLGVELSNNDLTAEGTEHGDRCVLSNVSPSLGSHYAEVFIDHASGTGGGIVGIGLCNQHQNLNGWVGEDSNGIALMEVGNILMNAFNCHQLFGFPFATGDTVRVHINTISKVFALAKNDEAWTDDQPINFLEGNIHLVAYLGAGGKVTVRFAPADWKFPAPVGAYAW